MNINKLERLLVQKLMNLNPGGITESEAREEVREIFKRAEPLSPPEIIHVNFDSEDLPMVRLAHPHSPIMPNWHGYKRVNL